MMSHTKPESPIREVRTSAPSTRFQLGKEMKGAGASQRRPALIRIKLPGMDSNHDEEYQKLLCRQRNHNSDSDLGNAALIGRTAGRTSEQTEGGIPDADLAALVAAWPTLPEPIKAAIRALVGAVR